MNLLVTGGAGFIGSHACEYFLKQGHRVTVLDNFDPFYPPEQKRRNIAPALVHPCCRLVEGDFGDRELLSGLLRSEKFDLVLHLAAQAGVRPSLADPLKYARVNVRGLLAMLEALREHGPRKLVAASSSSVYGEVTPAPFREDAPALTPLSPYAATKRAAEIFLGTYAQVYGFQIIIVRPFSVYGPRQRPDMAIAAFARKMLLGETVRLFGDGSAARDYTYVSDIVDGLAAAVERFPVEFGIYNLGDSRPVSLTELIVALERVVGKKARVEKEAPQPGDVQRTCADISKAGRDLGYTPKVGLAEGLARTLDWVKGELQFPICDLRFSIEPQTAAPEKIENRKSKIENPEVLVTGAAGFIGSHLVPRLLESGYSVSALVRHNAASSESSKRRQADLEQLQVRYKDKLQIVPAPDAGAALKTVQSARPEICVHLAGRSWVRESVALPEQYAEANYSETAALLNTLCQSGCRRVVFASTMVVYGKDAPLPYSEGCLGSAAASPYGASKLACEVLLNMYHALSRLETVNLRLFSVYGPDLRPDLVPYLIASAILQGKPFTVFGDGLSVRDYIEIRDVLNAIEAACRGRESHAALNIGSGVGTTLLELIELLQRCLGRKAELVYKPPVPGELKRALPDISLARQKLKWEPRVSLEAGMARLAEWFRSEARKGITL